tara:strand:- start:532 stop:807 length:276 start_codon:yes stop_codon:yes gene_type:complete
MSDVNVNIHKVEKITLKGKLIPNGCDDETFKVLDLTVHRKNGQDDTISLFCKQDVEVSIFEPDNSEELQLQSLRRTTNGIENEIIIPWGRN